MTIESQVTKIVLTNAELVSQQLKGWEIVGDVIIEAQPARVARTPLHENFPALAPLGRSLWSLEAK